MSKWLLAAVALAYLWTAIELFRKDDMGMGWAFFCYALSNIGFIVSIRG